MGFRDDILARDPRGAQMVATNDEPECPASFSAIEQAASWSKHQISAAEDSAQFVLLFLGAPIRTTKMKHTTTANNTNGQ
ncbi:hypothetical protein [Bradyrhizobium sp. BR13661]|jgi:hypothetical protein|uniref:hypothetical protein n=1 Tax=Bradyrhizobium sp. BR13661 TaxID=2940622 RepID=UPI002476D76E|nr:hypothetical protein [Bradyrhizobium sp. BR13661]MDH6259056.1 hypothetical protein [Bradyrhizobium sp. BR13661]